MLSLLLELLLVAGFQQADGKTTLEEQFHVVSRKERHLPFPTGSSMGMLLAFAIPLELPDQNVMFSYNIEANYNFPDNASQFHILQPTRRFFDFNRTFWYNIIESRLNSIDLNGHDCLLKLICEVANTEITHNGLLGDLIHIIFSPSTSTDENLLEEEQAEKMGQDQVADCSSLYSSCQYNLLDAISYFSE